MSHDYETLLLKSRMEKMIAFIIVLGILCLLMWGAS